ncbi:RagB/SusD family nutrient uptake outer membrane protein [Deminuibacter soli]|uniref:RagB/SusD family nutrient uptake outer membrane protein n=1 Tax=Deminuibacter soli TaxID=2291815 RepID=A0A3E1NKP2_9BACT|nr:RagB/SusD family nutrient uptake outer membrane protein [Deminuibacter soli]RFM28467.1 RagB/SusD family nutrient uptake outer membrane protein [Deminuibacter soli]
MKKKINKIWMIIPALSGAVLFNACNKSFLDQSAKGALSPDLLPTKTVLQALLAGAYAALDGQGAGNNAIAGGAPWEASPSNWIYGSVAGGDSHKGSSLGDQPPIVPIATAQEDPSNGFFNTKWKALYEGIARCNAVLKTVPQTPNLTATDRVNIANEARFLRGHYYFELKKFFNMVPWIDETTTDFNQPNDKDIWPMIEKDFKAAADSLGDKAPTAGQANKWAAKCYLAKTYVYEKKWTEAEALFEEIGAGGMTSTGLAYGLTDRFEDQFDAATKNNKETVFDIQMTANDGTNSIANANGGDMLNFPYNSPFRCCGFYQPSIDLSNSYRTDASGLPYLDDYNSHPVKNDMGVISEGDQGGAPFTPDADPLDPRIDWTIGRRGIPLHDWGNHPGSHWIRDQASAGPFANKKNLYWQATAGTYSDQSTWAPGSAINIHIIRYADVLLLWAETQAQLGNLSGALEHVNDVRKRAALPVNFLKTYADPANPMGGFSGTNAANYVIAPYASFPSQDYALKAIRFERKLELACEGQRFFDLVRWGIAETTMNAYYAYEGQITGDLPGGHFTAGKNEYFPIPQIQIDLVGKAKLKQNPNYPQ